jgi:L-lactate dehydrogenase (cytochrome)
VNSDRSVTEKLVRQVDAAGFKALFVTVDMATPGKRERDRRAKVDIAPPANYSKNKRDTSKGVVNSLATFFDPSLTWKDIEWLRSLTSMPIVLKGIQCAEDAILAVKYGAYKSHS